MPMLRAIFLCHPPTQGQAVCPTSEPETFLERKLVPNGKFFESERLVIPALIFFRQVFYKSVEMISPGKKLRLLLADDHELVRCGLQALIETRPAWKVCGVAGTGPQALEEAKRLKPDIVIVDMKLPGWDGLEVTRRIKRQLPECEILIFTGVSESDELIRNAYASGAKGFISKNEAPQFLLDALANLADHKPFFTDKASAVIFSRFSQPPGAARASQPPGDERLMPDEHKVVALLADGLTNAEVAKKLRVSVRTVENLRAGIMHKLQLNSFADLIRYAVRNGIIEL